MVCPELHVSPCANLYPIIIRKGPELVLWELNWVVGDLLCLGPPSNPTAKHAGRPCEATALAWLMRLIQIEREIEEAIFQCVCVCVCFRSYFISLVLWFFSSIAHLYVFCILACRNLLKTIGQKTQVIIMRVRSLEDALLAKTQVRCHTGANKCLCSYSPISPPPHPQHGPHQNEWTSRNHFLYICQRLVVFINIYPCWSPLATITVYFCDIFYTVLQRSGDFVNFSPSLSVSVSPTS